jgi:TldD protein
MKPFEPNLSSLAVARDVLLTPFGLDEGKLITTLGTMFTHKVDYADLYFQFTKSEGWSLEEGIVKSGSFSIDQGVGVRAVSGDKTAFAYSDDISQAALLDAAAATRTIARAATGRVKVAPGVRESGGRSLYLPHDPLSSLDATAKVQLLERVEKMARAKDPRVVQVMASLSGEYDVVLVVRSDGVLAADIRPLVRVSVTVIAEQNGRREVGSAGGGGRYDYAYFSDELLDQYATEAVKSALVNLEARPAPAGPMTIVLGPGWPGVLLHEAVGHGLEGDFNRKGSSAYAGMIGERVAAKGVTVVDDGTLQDRRGSLNMDDEGNPTQCTTLIEDGILKGYIQDTMNARLMKMPVTGNAHDQHLHAGGRQGPGRDPGVGQERPVRGELRGWPGRHHQRQVRILGQRSLHDRRRQDHLPGEGRDPDRQRSGHHEPHLDDRQRHAPGFRRGRVRQGRPERTGGRRPADPAHRWRDGGRHGLIRRPGLQKITPAGLIPAGVFYCLLAFACCLRFS